MPENYLRGFTEGVNVANKFRQAFIPDWILPGASFLPGPPYWWPEADPRLEPATWSVPSASPSFYSYNDTPLNQNYPSASHYPCTYQSYDHPPHSYQRMFPMDLRNTLPYVNPIESSQEGQLENFTRPQFQSPLLQASNDGSSYDTSRIPNAKATSPSPKSPISLSQPSTSMKRVKKANDITYASIIAQAIHSTPDKRLTVHGIYRWIEENYADTYDPRDKSWKNTVRHNLSRNICFKLIARRDHANGSRGRGGYWTTDPRCMSKLNNGVLAEGAIHKKRLKGGHSRKVQCGDRKTKECLERSFPPSVLFLSSSPSSSPAVTPDIACDESGFVALPPTECPSKSFLSIENILN